MVSAWGMTAGNRGGRQRSAGEARRFSRRRHRDRPEHAGSRRLRLPASACAMPATCRPPSCSPPTETSKRPSRRCRNWAPTGSWKNRSSRQPWRCCCGAPAAHAGLRAEKKALERQLSYKGALGELVGTSPKMQEIFALLQQAGPSKACVLITGESGTGKETGGAHAARAQPAQAGPVRRHQLRGVAGDADRERVVRPRKGLVHRRFRTPRGLLRSWRSTARCCWTKSARCRCRRRPSCCAFWKIRRCAGWAARPSSKWTCAWWRPPTKCPDEAVRGGHLREDLYLPAQRFPHPSAAAARAQEDISADRRGADRRPQPQARLPGHRDLADVMEALAAATTGRAMCGNCATCWSAR